MNVTANGTSLLLKNECAYSRGCSRNVSIASTASVRLPNNPVRQQATEESADDEEQMRQQMAHEVDVAGVLQAQGVFGQQQQQLEGHAVGAAEPGGHGIGGAQDVVGSALGAPALEPLVGAHAVVVHHGQPGDGEQQAYRRGEHRERDPPRRRPARRRQSLRRGVGAGGCRDHLSLRPEGYAAAINVVPVAGSAHQHTANPAWPEPGTGSHSGQSLLDFAVFSIHRMIHTPA